MALRNIRRNIQNDESERSTISIINSKIDDLSSYLLNKENFKEKSSKGSISPCARMRDYQSDIKKMMVKQTEPSVSTVSKGNSRYRFRELINTATDNSYTASKLERKSSPSGNSRAFSYFTNYSQKKNCDTQETLRKFEENLSTQPQFETPRLSIPTEEMENIDENTSKLNISGIMPSKSAKDEKIERLESKISSLIAENSRLSQKIQESGVAYQLLRKKSVDNTKEIELQSRIKSLEASNTALKSSMNKLQEELEEKSSALSISKENEKDLAQLNNRLNEELQRAHQRIHLLENSQNQAKSQANLIEELRSQNERREAEIATYIGMLDQKEKQLAIMKASHSTVQTMRGTRELIAEKFEESSISFNTEENPTYPFKKRSVSAFGRRI